MLPERLIGIITARRGPIDTPLGERQDTVSPRFRVVKIPRSLSTEGAGMLKPRAKPWEGCFAISASPNGAQIARDIVHRAPLGRWGFPVIGHGISQGFNIAAPSVLKNNRNSKTHASGW